MKEDSKDHWDLVIKPQRKLLDLRLKEILEYWDLLVLFIKKDIITVYKQTILGPFWFVIQPLLSTIVYIFIFGNIAKLPSDGIPKVLFYLSGVILWTIFSSSFITTTGTFTANMGVFGKVYFPRLIIPFSKLASTYIKFAIQFILFIGFYAYFMFTGEAISPGITILLLPIYLIILGGLGLGMGLIFSSLTTKYRDLKFLLAFGVQLLMYGTTVVYPLSSLAEQPQLRAIVWANPCTHVIEAFRYSSTGLGCIEPVGLLYSGVFMLIVLTIGVVMFNRTEQNFIDTV